MLAMEHCYLFCLCVCERVGVTESLISGNRPGREQGGEQEEDGGGVEKQQWNWRRRKEIVRVEAGREEEMGDRHM